MQSKKQRNKIEGPFYPWLAEMGNSEAMKRLRTNSDAVNAFTIFVSKYSLASGGKGLCVTYAEAEPFMSASTFAKAKLWCTAFGFLHCRQYGRLERKPSLYDLTTKWRHLSRHPDKLELIERLLKKHSDLLRRTAPAFEGGDSTLPKVRKHMELRQIEKEILGQ